MTFQASELHLGGALVPETRQAFHVTLKLHRSVRIGAGNAITGLVEGSQTPHNFMQHDFGPDGDPLLSLIAILRATTVGRKVSLHSLGPFKLGVVRKYHGAAFFKALFIVTQRSFQIISNDPSCFLGTLDSII